MAGDFWPPPAWDNKTLKLWREYVRMATTLSFAEWLKRRA